MNFVDNLRVRSQETDILTRQYRLKDAEHLMKAGYPFEDIDEWGSPYRDLKMKIISCLEHRARRRLVAHSISERKAVGTIKMDQISRYLWHVGGVFVSPSCRGRGIGSLLYHSAFDCLKKMDVRKAIANVEASNKPSVTTLEKTWDGFMSQSYDRYYGILRNAENCDSIKLRSLSPSDLDTLYGICRNSTEAEWRTFLEIEEGNFLDRFFGHISSTGLLRLWVRKRVLVAEEKGTVMGYVVMPTDRAHLQRHTQRMYLFLPPEIPLEEVIGLARRVFTLLLAEGYREVYLYFTNANKDLMIQVSDSLYTEFGLEKTEFLIAKKNL